jgi:hypothetical protein
MTRGLILTTESQELDWEEWEYGKPITQERRNFNLDRDPVTQTLCREIPAEAFAKGFTIVDKNGDEVEELKPAVDIVVRQNDQLIDAISYDRGLTHGLLVFSNPSDSPENKDVFIKAYTPENYAYGYDKVTGKYKEASVTIKYVKLEGDSNKKELVEEFRPVDATDSIHVATDSTDVIGEFKAWIDSLYDDNMGYYITSESGTIFMTRAGPGIMKWTVQQKDLATEEERKKTFNRLRKMSGKAKVILQGAFNKEQAQSDYELITPDHADWDAAVNIFLVRAAMRSKVPMARFKGLEPGQQAGAWANQAAYFDVLENQQHTYSEMVYMKSVQIVARNIGIDTKEKPFDYTGMYPQFNVRQSLTEVEQAELLEKKIKNFKELLDIHEKAGMKLEIAIEKTGMDYVPDKSLIAKFETMREQISAQVDNDPNKEQNPKDGDPEE